MVRKEDKQQRLTHFDEQGKAIMVDVSHKEKSHRTAVARAEITMNDGAIQALRAGTVGKGDVLGVARLAGIMAAKKTSELIPLCHPVPLTHIAIDFDIADNGVRIEATAKCTEKTGVEMEAITAATVSALTIYDMCKAMDKKMVIGDIYLAKKTGGKSGDFHHEK